jgi:hypothetical protein
MSSKLIEIYSATPVIDSSLEGSFIQQQAVQFYDAILKNVSCLDAEHSTLSLLRQVSEPKNNKMVPFFEFSSRIFL